MHLVPSFATRDERCKEDAKGTRCIEEVQWSHPPYFVPVHLVPSEDAPAVVHTCNIECIFLCTAGAFQRFDEMQTDERSGKE